jgi:amidase
MAAGVREKKFSSEELVAAHIAQIEATSPAINAVVAMRADEALDEARAADAALAKGEGQGDGFGPLHGLPFTAKDAFLTAGLVTTGGTMGQKDFVPDEDATAVARYRAAGAILLGKTNVPELSLALDTGNDVYGSTGNPYNPDYTPGGSSGGAAANVAAMGSPFEVGSDTGGSIRAPAGFCGIAGLKTTVGRVPMTGHWPPLAGPLSPISSVGPLARTVDDLTLLLGIMAGPDGRDPHAVPAPLGDPGAVSLKGMKIAVHTDNGIMAATPSVADAVQGAAKILAGEGAIVEEARPEGIEDTLMLFMAFLFGDGGAGLKRTLQEMGTTEPSGIIRTTQALAEAQGGASAADYMAGVVNWDLWRSRMLGIFDKFDAILCPVNAHAVMLRGGPVAAENIPAFTHTMTYNLTGWPGAVVRAGTSDEGMPVAVQLVAPPWREDVALALAKVIEDATGGWQAPEI